MAIAHDAATKTAQYTSTGTQNTSHAGSASAKGLCVLIVQDAGTADEVSGCTYGGVTVPRVRSDTAQGSRLYLYQLLSGVPTGTQTFAMTTTAGTAKVAWIVTMTVASGATIANENDGTNNSASGSPSFTVGTTAGLATQAYVAFWDGVATPTTTPTSPTALIDGTGSGSTHAFASNSALAGRQSGSGGTLTFAWTIASNAWLGVAVAYKEVGGGNSASGTATLSGGGAVTGTGRKGAVRTAAISGGGTLTGSSVVVTTLERPSSSTRPASSIQPGSGAGGPVSFGTVVIHGGGDPAADGFHGARRTAAVSGGGAVAGSASGFAPVLPVDFPLFLEFEDDRALAFEEDRTLEFEGDRTLVFDQEVEGE